jgi:hypothetical protein
MNGTDSGGHIADQELRCLDCGRTFLFTIGEQEFFASRRPLPLLPPRRCKPCRQVRRSAAQSFQRDDWR